MLEIPVKFPVKFIKPQELLGGTAGGQKEVKPEADFASPCLGDELFSLQGWRGRREERIVLQGSQGV